MVEAVTATVCDEPDVHDQNQQDKAFMQEHLFMFNYLSQSDWATLASAVPFTRKLHHMAGRCLSFGLAHPTEKTSAAIVAVAIGGAEEVLMPVSEMLKHVRDFKGALRSQLSRLPAFIEQPPKVFPESVADFKDTYSKIYTVAFAGGDPIPSKYSAAEWFMLVAKDSLITTLP